ncbi:MAG: DedA family protein [Planctomycetes bacterium]|nr:DedA family protein [Planctomycetota bacterium]
MEFMHNLYLWVLGLAESDYASLWLFVLAAAESSFFPIPPDVLLIALCIGAAAIGNSPMCFFYAAVCTVASVLGGALGYLIGLYGGRPIAVKLFGEKKVLAAEDAYRKYDVWAIGAAGFTPIPYKIFTILSGAMEVPFRRFILVSALSRGARFFLVALALFFFGAEVKSFLDDYFAWVTFAVFFGVVAGFVVVGLFSRRRKNVTTSSDNCTNSSSGTD